MENRKSARLPYHTPRLTTFGDVRALTAADPAGSGGDAGNASWGTSPAGS